MQKVLPDSEKSKKKCCASLNDWIADHRLIWLILIAIFGFGSDQATKIWAQRELAEPHLSEGRVIFYPSEVLEVIPNFLNLVYKENPSAAFSLTSSIPLEIRKPLLISVSILATIFFIIWYFRMRAKDGLLLASFSFILAGALGNLFDRCRLGYVIDFIDVHAGFLGYEHMHWPTFNIADSLIVIGAIGVICRTLWPYKESA